MARGNCKHERFAFDFDGVVCDSVEETAETAWRAACRVWPRRYAGDASADYVEGFRRCRPVIHTGFENLLLLDLLAAGHEPEAILAQFDTLSAQSRARLGLTEHQLLGAFAEARDAWIRADPQGWLNVQGFYPGVVEAINAMSAPRCIITTKQHRFTIRLAQLARLDIEPAAIFGLESGGKRAVLLRQLEAAGGAPVHFFEDRLRTLTALEDVVGLRRYLVSWGYNTVADRRAARADSAISVLDHLAFRRLLEDR